MRQLQRLAGVAFALIFASGPGEAVAGQTIVAVAANFTAAAKDIAEAFTAKTGHTAVLSFGASGQFYTQITQDAPFEVFLSADDNRPKKLEADKLAVAGSAFTYAIGKLVLWSPQPDAVKGEGTLRHYDFAKLSICNPAAAPYGAVAVETMKSLNLYETLQPKLVVGDNITQAYQFVQSGNAQVGFVALSQIIADKNGSRWMVPQNLYKPIRQDAVLLQKGANNEAASAFLSFLKGLEAKAIITRYGYALGEEN